MVDRSIHPRFWPDSKNRDKSNTCAAKRPETIARLLDALHRHCERHPNDKQSANRLRRLA